MMSAIGRRVLAADRHEEPRHDRELERHVALVAVAEVVDDVLRPLVRLGEQHAVGVAARRPPRARASGTRASRAGSRRSCRRARRGTGRRRAGSRRARGRARSAGRRASPPAPRGCRSSGRAGARRSGASSTGRRPGPRSSSTSRVSRKMIRRPGSGVGVGPDVPVALGRGGVGAGLLEPGMVARGVVHHEVGDHADPALVRGVDERPGSRRSCRSRGGSE